MPRSKSFFGARRALAVRRLRGGICLALLAFQTGCYTYLPVQAEVPAQVREVAVVLNDRGRVQMGDGLGPMVDRVEGVVEAQDSAKVRLRVNRVLYLQGNSAIWSGESLDIPRDGILGFRGRQLSKARSWALAAGVAGAVIVTALSFSLDLFGDGKTDPPCTGPSCGENPSIRQ